MKDVLVTVTIFHTLAAVAAFGFMVFSVIQLVSRQRD